MIQRIILILTSFSATIAAQWLHYPTPGIPRLPDGKPNLAAPAPKAADGKPDLSGVWTIIAAANPANDLKPGDVLPWAETLTKQHQENVGKDDPSYSQALEGEARLGAPAKDLSLLDLVISLEPEPGDLVLKELMDALLDGLHRLACAGYSEVLLRAGNQEVLGDRPGKHGSKSHE